LSSQDDSDRTVLVPNPGGRRRTPASFERPGPSAADPSPPLTNSSSAVSDAAGYSGVEPLSRAASPLLRLLPSIQHSVSQPQIDALRRQLLIGLHQFRDKARHAGSEASEIERGSYVLCTALDEAVMNTPWGNQCGWSRHTLLAELHRDASGGDRFFEWLKEGLGDPSRHRGLLELMYYCLALGFMGRFRVVAGGTDKLAQWREHLAGVIAQLRGSGEAELSPHWRGESEPRSALHWQFPLWAAAAGLLSLLALIYWGLLINLHGLSDPLASEIVSLSHGARTELSRAEPEQAAPRILPAKPTSSLSSLLATEIAAGDITITENTNHSRLVVVRGQLFRSASASINSQHDQLLSRIALALSQVPGNILVEGHTDSSPISSLRYPSNW